MTHYARVTDGIVTNVIVADEEFFETFTDTTAGEWVQTSYNSRGGVHLDPETGVPDNGTPLRYNYASVGDTYDRERDAFISPKPFPSYVLNEETCVWEAPEPYPTDGQYYVWDEDTVSWVAGTVDN